MRSQNENCVNRLPRGFTKGSFRAAAVLALWRARKRVRWSNTTDAHKGQRQIVQPMNEASIRTSGPRSSLGFSSFRGAGIQPAAGFSRPLRGLTNFSGFQECCLAETNATKFHPCDSWPVSRRAESSGRLKPAPPAWSTAHDERPKPTGELRSPGQAEAYPTKSRRRLDRCKDVAELRIHRKQSRLPLPPPRSHRAVLRSLRFRVSTVSNPAKQAS